MKSFDTNSILQRRLNYLASGGPWSQIINDSAIVLQNQADSETEAEIVRYFEYLLKESKWKQAQNLSSLVTQAEYLGYSPLRKTSAQGYISVSHSNLLLTAGINNDTIETLDADISAYAGSTISIPRGTTLSSGTSQYIVTQSCSYLAGTKLLPIPVIQGIQTSVSAVVLGNPFEKIRIASSGVEAGSNTVSASFITVVGVPSGSSFSSITFTQVDDIYSASNTEYAYQIITAKDFSYVDIMFGNGFAGALAPKNYTVTISYLETLGVQGNIYANYQVNTINGSFTPQLYCSNVPSTSGTTASVLGGADEEGVEDIRANAPLNYLNTGSIITTNQYKKAISDVPGIRYVNVYPTTYVDTNTGSPVDAIGYTAINDVGEIPDNSTLLLINDAISGKNSPLDRVAYEQAKRLHLRLNITGKTKGHPISTSAAVTSGVIDNFGSLVWDFGKSFDNSILTNYLMSNTSLNLSSANNMVEAITDLVPSSFYPDNSLPGYYTQTFSFDRSYLSLKSASTDSPYWLKINIVFDCVACAFTSSLGTSTFSRTLFLLPESSVRDSFTFNFSVLNPSVGVSPFINVCGDLVLLTTQTIQTPQLIVQAILKYKEDTPGAFSLYDVTPSSSISSLNIAPKYSVGATASPYITWDTNAIRGVTVTSNSTGVYRTAQYLYTDLIELNDVNSPVITNKAFMGKLLDSSSPIKEIQPDNILIPYIPIRVTIDTTSFNPTDLNSNPLGYGIISIPKAFPVAGSPNGYYINFGGGVDSTLDSTVSIQVIAQPNLINNTTVTPYYDNNIIRVLNYDTVTNPTIFQNDVITEITNA